MSLYIGESSFRSRNRKVRVTMQDEMIVELYWQRDERAIEETDRQYGAYLFRIACNILADVEDSRESLSDTYLKAWNSIPPARPPRLVSYLGRLARQAAIDRLRRQGRQKRGGQQYEQSLSELSECISGGDETQRAVEYGLLAEAVSRWLWTLAPHERQAFICRYFFLDGIAEIAAALGFSSSKVKSLLFRLRSSLREYLQKEGFEL